MPTVFLSYRHENDAHRARVRALAERLQLEGAARVRVILDQIAHATEFHYGGPPEGWPQWSVRQVGGAERILIVGSAGWFRCYEGKEEPGRGLGAASEARVIQQRLYKLAGRNPDIRIVVLAPEDGAAGVPIDLEGYHRFEGDRDFADLLAWLTYDAATAAPAPAPGEWPEASPALDWPLADFFHVRDGMGPLLTAGSPHRVLLLQGPSEVGKSYLTRHLFGLGLRLPWLACGRFDLKAGAELEGEFRRFATHLEVEASLHASAGQPVVRQLDVLLSALRQQARPTLLIFDTFEQGGECARWVEEQALVAAVRSSWLRIVVAGQRVPGLVGAPWAAVTAPPLFLQQISWEDWHFYGKRNRPDLTPELARQFHIFARGRHPLLAQLLGPSGVA